MPKAKKRSTIDDFEKVDGKTAETRKIKTKKGRIQSLDELTGHQFSRFPTSDEAEYEKILIGMSYIDLQKECTRHNLFPSDNILAMRNRLRDCFKNSMASLRRNRPDVIILKAPLAKKIMAQSASRPV